MGDLPGARIAIRPKRTSAARLEYALRFGNPPMITLVKDDAVLLDPRKFSRISSKSYRNSWQQLSRTLFV